MRKRLLILAGVLLATGCLAGCQQKDPEPGEVAGYDEGEEYLSIWVHSIEDTEEGQAYRESVDSLTKPMTDNTLRISNSCRGMTAAADTLIK